MTEPTYEITKTPRDDIEGYEYRMTSKCGYGDVVIKVGAEIFGHGSLYSIELPKMVSSSNVAETDTHPTIQETLHVLNKIFEDYHMKCSIIKGILEKI